MCWRFFWFEERYHDGDGDGADGDGDGDGDDDVANWCDAMLPHSAALIGRQYSGFCFMRRMPPRRHAWKQLVSKTGQQCKQIWRYNGLTGD